MIILVQSNYLKIFNAYDGNFNIKLRPLEAKLKAYLCQKLRLPVTDNIFTIKTPLLIVKMSLKNSV